MSGEEIECWLSYGTGRPCPLPYGHFGHITVLGMAVSAQSMRLLMDADSGVPPCSKEHR